MTTNPLVSTDWLEDRLGSDDVRIVDTRWYLDDEAQGRREYGLGHIRGAVFLDLDSDLSGEEGPGRHPLPDRELFANTLSTAGIGSAHHVIVYDHGPGAIAARMWWMLRWAGHSEVSVLDGGFAAWQGAGLATSSSTPGYTNAEFTLGEQLTRTIDRSALRSRLGEVQIFDARAGDRYRGETEPVDPVAGHIPTALSAPTTGNLGPDGRFKSPDALAARFIGLGAERSASIISSCGSGVTACHNILALHIAGFPEPTLYPGSWSDWSSAGYPAASGPTPGGPARRT